MEICACVVAAFFFVLAALRVVLGGLSTEGNEGGRAFTNTSKLSGRQHYGVFCMDELEWALLVVVRCAHVHNTTPRWPHRVVAAMVTEKHTPATSAH